MTYPLRGDAERLLSWAEHENPGPWVDHSRVVANAAEKIAAQCGLDGEKAFALGLLHDVGRYAGVTDLKHVFDGYALLREKGYAGAAQICLTHSFHNKAIGEYLVKNDCSPEEYAELRDELERCVFSDYDRLIQLCDSLALPTGVCLMEKRLVDVARRHGVRDYTPAIWATLFASLERFDALAGKRIYSLFPEIVENTFG